MTQRERLGGHFLLALGLQLRDLYGALAAGDHQRLDAQDGPCRSAALCQTRAVELDALAADNGSGDRPRIESADLVMDLL